MSHQIITKESQGYITLMSVLLAGALGTAITISVILLGLNSSRMSFTHEQSAQAKALADACIEEALQEIRSDTNYTGIDSLSLGQGSCSVLVVNSGGENRTLTASSTTGTITRRVEVDIDAIEPAITITSWQEVASF